MENKDFLIDGIGSSSALDTSGEIVDLKGLDITSLVGAPINYEHKKDFPSQLVGKITEAKKIFSKEECENPRHLYFWEKVQLPFLYVKARLFKEKPSSQEVIALFKDDAEHPQEPDMLGFSVEGSKIEKVGAVITRSIARLVTLAAMPANKTCIAEMAPQKDRKVDPNDVSELFKGEMQLFSFEPNYIQILEKKEELKKDVGSGGGAFIGSQLAMSESKKLKKDATVAPDNAKPVSVGPTTPPPTPPTTVTAAGISAGFNGAMGFGKREKKEKKLQKAISAGSGMAAPGQLVGGSALSPEDLDRKKMHKKEKSKWYQRADEAYKTWDKREHFRQYMKKRMPHLANGEVDAIGKVLALKKNFQAEKNLSKMFASHFIKDEIDKGTDIMMAGEDKKKKE